METIYVGLSTTRKFNIVASLIHFFERANYSHVYVRIPSKSLDRDLIYEASSLTVHFTSRERFMEHSKVIKEYTIDVSPETKVKTLQFAIDNLEKPYGAMQLVGMMWVLVCKRFGKKVKNPFPNGNSAYICSELGAAVLEELGYKMDENMDNIDPKDIDQFLASKGLPVWPDPKAV